MGLASLELSFDLALDLGWGCVFRSWFVGFGESDEEEAGVKNVLMGLGEEMALALMLMLEDVDLSGTRGGSMAVGAVTGDSQ